MSLGFKKINVCGWMKELLHDVASRSHGDNEEVDTHALMSLALPGSPFSASVGVTKKVNDLILSFEAQEL